MRKVFSIGLIRGLVFQIFWTIIGAGLVSIIRYSMGLWWWKWDEVNFGFSEGA